MYIYVCIYEYISIQKYMYIIQEVKVVLLVVNISMGANLLTTIIESWNQTGWFTGCYRLIQADSGPVMLGSKSDWFTD